MFVYIYIYIYLYMYIERGRVIVLCLLLWVFGFVLHYYPQTTMRVGFVCCCWYYFFHVHTCCLRGHNFRDLPRSVYNVCDLFDMPFNNCPDDFYFLAIMSNRCPTTPNHVKQFGTPAAAAAVAMTRAS